MPVPGIKPRIKRVLDDIGIDPQWVRQARTATGRRDWRDNRNLRLVTSAMLNVDSNCLDIGANVGSTLEDMVRVAPQGRHIAIEAIPELAADLRSRFRGVTVEQVAVTDRAGEVTFNVVDNDHGLSGLRQRDWMGHQDFRQITVRAATLDELVAPDHHIDFVKIDVEGAEVLVLRGGRRILGTDRPYIWLDHGHRSAELHGTTTRDLWELLTEFDYRLFTADGEGPLTWEQFSATDGMPIWTFMAHP